MAQQSMVRNAAMLAALALPAAAQSPGFGGDNIAPVVTNDLANAARTAAKTASSLVKETEKAQEAHLETLLGKKQFVIGAYPVQDTTVKTVPLGGDLFVKAQEVSRIEGTGPRARLAGEEPLSLWIENKGMSRKETAKRKGVTVLAEPSAELVVVRNDAFLRAKQIGLLAFNGTSTVSVTNPESDEAPFEAAVVKRGELSLSTGPIVRRNPTLPRPGRYVSTEDNEWRGKPEFVAGPLKGQSLCVGTAEGDSFAGLTLSSGSVRERVIKDHDNNLTWDEARNQGLLELKRDSNVFFILLDPERSYRVKDLGPNERLTPLNPLARVISAFGGELEDRFHHWRRTVSSDKRIQVGNLSAFTGPADAPELEGGAKARAFVQRQIEAYSRFLTTESLLGKEGALTAKRLRAAGLTDEALSALSAERISAGKEAGPSSVAEAAKYFRVAVGGLNEDTVSDCKEYLLERYRKATTEERKAYWKKTIGQLDSTVETINREKEEMKKKGDIFLQEIDGVDYPWQRFPFTLPLSDVVPGMFWVRIRP